MKKIILIACFLSGFLSIYAQDNDNFKTANSNFSFIENKGQFIDQLN